MLLTSAFRHNKDIHMAENQIIALKGRHYQFKCIVGEIWITAPAGGDRVITSGQQATMDSAGKICIQAFAPSIIQIRKTNGDCD